MPDGEWAQGGASSGTSMAAPLVSGVAAMMRAVDPMLNHDGIRQLLMQTGWAGTGRVTRGLDAHAAVLAAMGGRLTEWTEPNDTRATAARRVRAGQSPDVRLVHTGRQQLLQFFGRSNHRDTPRRAATR
jgi:subtilisin family serine protease